MNHESSFFFSYSHQRYACLISSATNDQRHKQCVVGESTSEKGKNIAISDLKRTVVLAVERKHRRLSARNSCSDYFRIIFVKDRISYNEAQVSGKIVLSSLRKQIAVFSLTTVLNVIPLKYCFIHSLPF